MIEFCPEGWLINTNENRLIINTQSNLMEAYHEKKILESKAIICDSDHNLIVDLGEIKGIIPREEGAIGIKEGFVRDIAIISRVNRPVSFIITGFKKSEKDEKTIAILSRRIAQEMCMEEYVSKLKIGDIIDAKVTHLEPFGAFCDIGCGIASLLPIDMISVSRIDHPSERFSVGMNIKVIVKSIEEDGRIGLSHKELLGTWKENADLFSIGETVAGIVRSVEDYGAFIELAPNLAGLAEPKEGIVPGQQASVYIKNIIPSRMKIKLIIIDTFEYNYKPSEPDYFLKSSHIEKFKYSPDDCEKVVETIF